MAKASTVLKGTRARLPVRCSLQGPMPLPSFDEQGSLVFKPSDDTFVVDLRVLNPLEAGEVFSSAIAYAKNGGVENPGSGNDLYEFGIKQFTLLYACVDHDSPEDRPEPFFDGGIDQIRERFDSERIAFLFELQQEFQERCSPRHYNLSQEEFWSSIALIGSLEEQQSREFFFALPRDMQFLFTRFTANQLINSPSDKSSPGSPSEPVSENSKPKANPNVKRKSRTVSEPK